MSNRTFKVQSPHLRGDDVREWQEFLNRKLRYWGARDDLLIVEDGDYGIGTRTATSQVLYGLGISLDTMAAGVTPELRIKVRNSRLTAWERARYIARAGWRKKLGGPQVSSPLAKITADSWGWHPGVHDGIDLICPPDAVITSMTDGEVVRADAGGWWGLGAPADAALRAKGDGIVIVRCTEDVGPFRKDMNVCYGHAEKARVKAGDRVKAGQPIAHAGLANAWHIHLMVNDNPDTRGVGDRDPRPFYDYARKNG